MFNFGEHLKALRKAQNITQKQLAQDINASERGIQNYELNLRKPTYDILIALADYFDVSIDYLVGRTDNPEINK
ncbi:helix-turn-helix domain-containing protein [Anaerovorax sp. IOR16]|uniref:helix-turn-helix domain-containing protein n=1 Tax=Anaerovorax sp. IOR16 TaxID=2773458 RepID=UPI0019D10601|nr:helix-turn-helix transcriptional regulator [Anaerovorax sp. IOR16]